MCVNVLRGEENGSFWNTPKEVKGINQAYTIRSTHALPVLSPAKICLPSRRVDTSSGSSPAAPWITSILSVCWVALLELERVSGGGRNVSLETKNRSAWIIWNDFIIRPKAYKQWAKIIFSFTLGLTCTLHENKSRDEKSASLQSSARSWLVHAYTWDSVCEREKEGQIAYKKYEQAQQLCPTQSVRVQPLVWPPQHLA